MSPARKIFATILLLAVLGFSYALATNLFPAGAFPGGAATRNTVQPRAVGQPLRFTNPFLNAGADPAYPNGGAAAEPQGFDLGDACADVQFTRYLNATGGFLPYTFESKPNFAFLGTNVQPPLPKLFLNGQITDKFNAVFGPGQQSSPLRFNAQVSDFIGTQRTGTFRLNLVPCPTAFRFAQDKLPKSQLGNAYFTNLEMLSASSAGGVVFSVVTGSITAGGAAAADLAAVGLQLTPNGFLFGRPVVASSANTQLIAFTVRALDAANAVALSRDGSKLDQVFTLEVEPNVQATSEVLALRAMVTGDKTKPGSGTFSYNGVFDPKGATRYALAGTPFTLRFGDNIYTGSFDDKGKLKQAQADKSVFNVELSPEHGTIAIRMSGITMKDSEFPASDNRNYATTAILSMEFKHYRACEVLSFKSRFIRGKLSSAYGLGARGSLLCGGHQVLSVVGQDRKLITGTPGSGISATDGDSWRVRWMGVPRFGIDKNAAAAIPVRDPKGGLTQSASVMATIRIGETFSQQVAAALRSDRLIFKATSKDPGIYKLQLDGGRFIHNVETNVLTEGDTQLPQAIKVKNLTIFRFGMDVPNFSGETGRVIEPERGLWKAR